MHEFLQRRKRATWCLNSGFVSSSIGQALADDAGWSGFLAMTHLSIFALLLPAQKSCGLIFEIRLSDAPDT